MSTEEKIAFFVWGLFMGLWIGAGIMQWWIERRLDALK